MEKRVLGRSGIEISAMGLGCWAIGGAIWRDGKANGWGQVDDEQSVRAIEKGLEDASQAKELAQQALAEVQEKLSTKDERIKEIIAASVSSGEKEKERLIADGKRLSEMVLEQAKSNIQYEVKQAKDAIKAEAAELAMELARNKVEGKLDSTQQENLLEEAMQRLEGRN